MDNFFFFFFYSANFMFSLSVSLPQGISGESCSTREEEIYHLAIVSITADLDIMFLTFEVDWFHTIAMSEC